MVPLSLSTSARAPKQEIETKRKNACVGCLCVCVRKREKRVITLCGKRDHEDGNGYDSTYSFVCVNMFFLGANKEEEDDDSEECRWRR
jgi:hypothetical protein